MLNLQLTGVNEVVARFGEMPDKIHDALLVKMAELTQRLIAKTQDNLSGKVLQSRSGALRDSIAGQISDTGSTLTATVGSYGVRYAAIQEYGGTTSPHDILPTKANALAFIVDGKQVFAKIVHHPGSRIPPHYYLQGALDDMHDEIVRGLGEAIVEGAIL